MLLSGDRGEKEKAARLCGSYLMGPGLEGELLLAEAHIAKTRVESREATAAIKQLG